MPELRFQIICSTFIEARLEIDQGNTTTAEAATIVVVVEHQDRSVAGLGLTLAEGRALLAEAQSVLVSHQAAGSTADLQGLFVATERALADSVIPNVIRE